MDNLGLEAIARAKLRNDPALKAKMEALGVSLEDAAKEYSALLGGETAAPAPRQAPGSPPPPSKQTVEAVQRVRRGHRKDSLPTVIMDILHTKNAPMYRQEVFEAAKTIPWVAELANPEKAMGTAILRLLEHGYVRELEGPKPRRIEAAMEAASKFF